MYDANADINMHRNAGTSDVVYQAGGYLRLSREDAEAAGSGYCRSSSIENQREYITEFRKSRPEITTLDFYIDDGWSGVDFDRPAFQQMMADIRAHKINCVIVKDLSRFGRNYIETGKYIERLFPLIGVRFIAINDHYDSADEEAGSNYMVLPFKNLINDAYCRDISIKIRSHLEIKRKHGEFVGAFPVYGYQRGIDRHKLVVDPCAAEIVKEIFRMKLDGMSSRAVADELNRLGVLSPAEYKREHGSSYKAVFQTHCRAEWMPAAVSRILSNEVYTGTLVQGRESTYNYKVKARAKKPREAWARVEHAHEAVVNQADFELVSEIMERDTRAAAGKSAVSAYAGYLFCADCGCSMVRKKASAQYVYYVCSGNKRNKNACSSHRISESSLKKGIAAAVRFQLDCLADARDSFYDQYCNKEETRYLTRLELLDTQSAERQKELRKYRCMKQDCGEDHKNGWISDEEYQMIRTELENRIQKTEQAANELKKKRALLADSRSEQEFWMKEFLCGKSVELKRVLFIRLVSRIHVYEGRRIEIIFRYRDEIYPMLKAL